MHNSTQVQVCFAQLARQTQKKEKSMSLSRPISRSKLYDIERQPQPTAPAPAARKSLSLGQVACSDAASGDYKTTENLGAVSYSSSLRNSDKEEAVPGNAQDIFNQLNDALEELGDAVSRLHSCASPYMKDTAIHGMQRHYLNSDDANSALEDRLVNVHNRVTTLRNDVANLCDRITFTGAK